MRRLGADHPAIGVAGLLAYNALWSIRLALHRATTDVNSGIAGMPTEQAVRYTEAVFEFYRKTIAPEAFHGSAAEIGPGGSAGVALLLRQAGCEHVDLVDRFLVRTSGPGPISLYRELARRHHLD